MSLLDTAELSVREAFEALDQYRGLPNNRSNGILNWDDYQCIISTKGQRRGTNVTFSAFARAALFLESRRRPHIPLSPNYACSFSTDDWLRRLQIFPDEAFIVAYDFALAQHSPRFQVRFSAKTNSDHYSLSFLKIQATVDIVLLENGSVRLELFNDNLDRLAGRVARTAEISIYEIQKRDNRAASFLTETSRAVAANSRSLLTGNGFSNFQRTFKVSDELLGYIWQFVRGDESSVYSVQRIEPPSFFLDGYPHAHIYQPLQWVYQIFAIPPDVPATELPDRIIGNYNGDPVKAVEALREIFSSNVFTVLERDQNEDEVEMIFQSSFISPFDKQNTDRQFLSMLVKADVLLSIQKNPYLVCRLYQLPRRLRSILLLHVFNENNPIDMPSVSLYRESVYRRMTEALDFAGHIASLLNEEVQPKDILIEIVNKAREWFPHVDLHPDTMDSLWSMVGGHYEKSGDKFNAFYSGINFLFAALHHGLLVNRALKIIGGLSSQAHITLNRNEDGSAQLAALFEKINKGGFLTAVTLPRGDVKRRCGAEAAGCWLSFSRFRDLPDSLLSNHKFYLNSDLGIKDGYHTVLHELLHGARNYGCTLNRLTHNDYKIDDTVKRNELPNWLNEAMTEYFVQREMRRRGLDPGGNFCSCKIGVFAIRSLIRSYGEPLEEAFLSAYLSGDFTRVKDILNQRGPLVFSGLMSVNDYAGVEALNWVRSLDINTFYDDWD